MRALPSGTASVLLVVLWRGLSSPCTDPGGGSPQHADEKPWHFSRPGDGLAQGENTLYTSIRESGAGPYLLAPKVRLLYFACSVGIIL